MLLFLFLFHVVPLTLHSHRNRFPVCLGTFLSSAPGCPERRAGRPFGGFSRGADFPHETERAFPFYTVSPFITQRRDYYGSAAIPKEDGVKETLSSPLHKPGTSSETYSRGLLKQPRQRGTSPVQLTNHFSQVIPPSTRLADNVNHTRIIRNSNKGMEFMLHPKGGDSHDGQAGMIPPGISLPGLFDTLRYRNALANIPPIPLTSN